MKPSQRDIHCLELFNRAKPGLKRELAKDKHLVSLISQCCSNLLAGTYKVSPGNLQKLKKHKRKIINLARKKTPLAKKVKIIQSGGFLSMLIPAAIGLISSLFGKQ